jgi:hypothetical protein
MRRKGQPLHPIFSHQRPSPPRNLVSMAKTNQMSQKTSVEEKAKLILSLNKAYKDGEGISNLTNGAKKVLYSVV